MAFVRGRLGIEYTTTPRNDDDGFRKGPLVAATLLVAAIIVAVNFVARKVREMKEPAEDVAPAVTESPKPSAMPAETEKPKSSPKPRVTETIQRVSHNRPPKLKQLLDRLDAAEKSGDTLVAIAAIEDIRAYPGDAAADLDDRLARRLGELNMIRLWEMKDARLVSEVTVRPGDNATRIARANGTTLAAIKKLNKAENIDLVKSGTKIKVMRLPRFILVVHLRLKTADLQLNGKFFKRYDIQEATAAAESGSFEVKSVASEFLAGHGLKFDPETSKELDTLMPRSSILVISEM